MSDQTSGAGVTPNHSANFIGYEPLDTNLQGRVAFVTGGARGIARAICIALAHRGADVCIADAHLARFEGERYYRLRQRVSTAEEEVPTAEVLAADYGVRAHAVQVDVSDPAAVRGAAAEAIEALGNVDILVNGAGIVNNLGHLSTMAPESWAHELAVNLSGAFHCVQALVPAMAERGWGRVISIASVAALKPSPTQPAYTPSKAGLVGLAQTVAATYGPSGVTSNAILPGLIATPLVLSMPEEMRTSTVNRTLVRRLGQPADIAALAAFLASPAAAFVNGVAIPCDGGLVLA